MKTLKSWHREKWQPSNSKHLEIMTCTIIKQVPELNVYKFRPEFWENFPPTNQLPLKKLSKRKGEDLITEEQITNYRKKWPQFLTHYRHSILSILAYHWLNANIYTLFLFYSKYPFSANTHLINAIHLINDLHVHDQ